MNIPFLDIHTHRIPVPQNEEAILPTDNRTETAVLAVYNLSFSVLRGEQHEYVPSSSWKSAGIHPWDVNPETLQEDLRQLDKLAGHDQVLLIGECGLDKMKGPELKIQQQAFTDQIRIANARHKPLIVHCVRAFEELIAITKEHPPQVPVIIHGFNKSPELARQLSNHGFLLSFGAALLEPKQPAGLPGKQADSPPGDDGKQTDNPAGRSLQDCWNRGQPFFLETDNSNANIEEIYARAANLLKISVDALKDAIFASWKKIGLNHE